MTSKQNDQSKKSLVENLEAAFEACKKHLSSERHVVLDVNAVSEDFDRISIAARDGDSPKEFTLAAWAKHPVRLLMKNGSVCQDRLFDFLVVSEDSDMPKGIYLPTSGITENEEVPYVVQSHSPFGAAHAHLLPLADETQHQLADALNNAPATA